MNSLIIVESPTKAKTLNRFLGSGYSVVATMGHIKDLPKSKLGVDVEHDFAPDYVVVKKRGDTIKKIKDEAKKAKEIFIATDPDREGEAIASHVEDVLRETKKLKNKKTEKQLLSSSDSPSLSISRISFHEITKSAVDEAIKNPHQVGNNLVDAQIARRVLDRLVGYKLSPVLWKKVRRGLSAGRVQTVAVRLIVEREREIQAFKPEEYWEIFVEVSKVSQVLQVSRDNLVGKTNPLDTFISQKSKVVSETNSNSSGSDSKTFPKGSNPLVGNNDAFWIKLIKINDKKVDIKDGESAKKAVSELENSNYKVSDVKKKEVRKSPYPPYTTSTLTQAASRIMGWSAKKTMSAAQALYEEGLITYHRTDSTNLAVSAVMSCRDFIKKEYGDKYLPEKPRFYKTTSKVAQEAHEAIRPTEVKSKFKIQNSKFTREAETLYNLIWKRFVACQMNPAIYDETVIDVEAKYNKSAGSDPEGIRKGSDPLVGKTVSGLYLLRVSGQTIIFDGWKVLYSKKTTDERLQTTENQSEAGGTSARSDLKMSQKRSDLLLGKTDETDNILPNVSKNDPLTLIKVDPQQKFTQPPARYTEAMLIKTLEKLGIGRPSTYAPTINTIQIRGYVEKDEGKFFPTSVGFAVNDFLLTNFPDNFEYSFTAQMERELDYIANGKLNWVKMMKDFYTPFEKKVVEAEEKGQRVKIEVEKLGKKCPECKDGEQVIRTGRFGKFISCSRFPDCKFTAKYEVRIDIKCPECKEGEVIMKKSKRGRKFYGCNRYPKCKWASWNKPSASSTETK